MEKPAGRVLRDHQPCCCAFAGRPASEMGDPMTIATRPAGAPADLSTRFGEVRCFTDALARPLSAEDQTVQTMPDVSPTKWHRAHTTWFFETFVLGPHVPGYEVVDPAYGYLFNS